MTWLMLENECQLDHCSVDLNFDEEAEIEAYAMCI